jgi:exoribonuclease II
VEQNGITEVDAAVMKDGLVRAETLPLVFRVPGTESLPRGSRVRARVTGVDLLQLELYASLAARLDEPAAAAEEDAAEDDAEAVGGLQIALTLDDAEAPAPLPAAAAEGGTG